MPRKNQPGCPCCKSRIKVCVSVCGGLPVVGAIVTVYASDGSVLGFCLTGTTGCCTIKNVSGRHRITVTISGVVVYSAIRQLTGTIVIALGAGAQIVCCGKYAIPMVLTLTDSAGSLSFLYYPNSFFPTWYGGHAVQRESCSVTTPNNICVAAPASEGPVRICYQMICYASQDPTFALQRSWSWVYAPGTLDPVWYQDPSGFVAGQPCTTGPPAMCGSPHTDVALDSQNPTETSPFMITFNPEPPVPNSNYTEDPVGRPVLISA